MPDPRAVRQRVSLGDRVRAFLNPPRQVEGSQRPQPDPGRPLPPTMPEETSPRSWIPRTGRNLAGGPRGEGDQDLTAFDLLWALANQSPLAGVCIADVVNQISGMDWTVRLREDFKGQEEKYKREIEIVRAWLREPFPLKRRLFRPWLRRVVREVLVTDALALVPRFDRAGRPLGLQQISGKTVKPIVDATGEPPDPPAAAFQQWVEGQPETEYTVDQLWYLPMNPRPDSPYGISATEIVLLTINWAMRGDLYDLARYTTGTIPDSIGALPGFNAKQVQDWQEWWDRRYEGNDRARAGGTAWVPGPEKGSLDWKPTFTDSWSYEQKEWGARLVSWAYGVSPMPIAKLMNRSTSETMEISALESGPRPVAAFLAECALSPYAQRCLGCEAIEIAPAEDETEEPAVTIERHRMLVSVGGMSRNELREANGLPADKDDPNGDRPYVVTPAGVVYLDEMGREDRKPDADTNGDGGATGSTPPGQPADAAEDLRRWHGVASKCVKQGRAPRPFTSSAIPEPLARAIAADLAKATNAEEVRRAFRRPLPLGFTRARPNTGGSPLTGSVSSECLSDG